MLPQQGLALEPHSTFIGHQDLATMAVHLVLVPPGHVGNDNVPCRAGLTNVLDRGVFGQATAKRTPELAAKLCIRRVDLDSELRGLIPRTGSRLWGVSPLRTRGSPVGGAYRHGEMPSNLTPLPAGRREEVEGLLEAVRRWAGGQADLHAVALVGSWARGAARADSDVDVVLLTDAPAAYLEDDRWIAAFGALGVVHTQKWGVVTERRVAMASGVEVEFGFASPEWASTDPLDAGTRAVVSDGLVALYDPEGLLAELVDAVSRTAS